MKRILCALLIFVTLTSCTKKNEIVIPQSKASNQIAPELKNVEVGNVDVPEAKECDVCENCGMYKKFYEENRDWTCWEVATFPKYIWNWWKKICEGLPKSNEENGFVMSEVKE